MPIASGRYVDVEWMEARSYQPPSLPQVTQGFQ
jgi:hypothetical protein